MDYEINNTGMTVNQTKTDINSMTTAAVVTTIRCTAAAATNHM